MARLSQKVCSKCKVKKDFSFFPKDKTKVDGYYCSCKECRKKYRLEHLSVYKKRDKNYYLNNKEKRSEYNKKYRSDNRERLIAYSKKYNKSYLSVEENKLKNNQRWKSWEVKNKEKIRKRKKIYTRERLKKDVKFKICRNLRARLKDALSGKIKVGSAIKDLGCNTLQLKQWIEQQFYFHPKTGEVMTWKNYGIKGWHIDHIIPLSSFDLTKKVQLKKACHWFNLQPLWAEENLSKGGQTNR